MADNPNVSKLCMRFYVYCIWAGSKVAVHKDVVGISKIVEMIFFCWNFEEYCPLY